MTDINLVTYFYTVIKKTGKYTRAYEGWLQRGDNEKMYAHLKEFWRAAHLKYKRPNSTASQYQYGGKTTEK